jgi:hypothetical protein
MGLYAINELPEKKKEGLVYVMNYTTQDFSMDYLDDSNKSQTVIIPALDTKPFPSSLADMVVTHLANFILNLQDFHYKTDPKLEIAKIKEKVIVNE